MVTLNQRIQSLLLARKIKAQAEAGKRKKIDDDFVFPAKEGGAINDNNFNKRAWNRVLKKQNIEYRPPYITRHSVVSHAIDLGLPPVMIAEQTGHDIKTLYNFYLSSVGKAQLPDLIEDWMQIR